MAIDRDLIEGWLRARSIARGLPQPVRDASGALRLETGSPDERRRYLFATLDDGLLRLAATIDQPLIFVKACAPGRALRAMLPPQWSILPDTTVMTAERADRGAIVRPAGFAIETRHTGAAVAVTIVAPDDALAASGHAASADGVYAYDRIVTRRDFRRRGLGRVVMATLAALKPDPRATDILVATDEGRALYTTIGWRARSPYATATIPATGAVATR